MNRRKYLAAVAGIGGVALAGCSEEEETTSASSDDNGGDNGGDNGNGGGNQGLVIEDHELVQDEFTMQIEGTLLNDTGEEQSYIEGNATVYNEDDVRVDELFANTTELAQGERWAFEVLITADAEDVDRYELEASTSAV